LHRKQQKSHKLQVSQKVLILASQQPKTVASTASTHQRMQLLQSAVMSAGVAAAAAAQV
jgi:hypothetical protein